MIGSLRGKVQFIQGQEIIIDVGGVGYRVSLPRSVCTVSGGDSISLFIYTHVREDELSLFGFKEIHDLRLFENLLKVSGIGPKTALGVFSAGTRDEIIKATIAGDVEFFEKVPRLGRKNAQKIIIELKSKFGDLSDIDLSDKDKEENNEVILALRTFGFSTNEARDAIKNKDKQEEQESPEEEVLFTSLRAGAWDEFFGQEGVKQALHIAISAAKKRKEPMEHILLYGPPGLGKTTVSHLIAKEMGVSIKITSGPAIERAGDLASILTNLEAGDILFIDEIHRLNKVVEETLYPAMEDY